jgi:hypothetical protein
VPLLPGLAAGSPALTLNLSISASAEASRAPSSAILAVNWRFSYSALDIPAMAASAVRLKSSF